MTNGQWIENLVFNLCKRVCKLNTKTSLSGGDPGVETGFVDGLLSVMVQFKDVSSEILYRGSV